MGPIAVIGDFLSGNSSSASESWDDVPMREQEN